MTSAAMQDLEGKVAVVTGAASGIGAGLCRALAQRGARVFGADVEAARLTETVAALGERAVAHVTDVSDPGSVAALARRVHEDHAAADLVFANAGVFAGGLLWEGSDRDWDWVLGVNVRGVVHTIRELVPAMLAARRGGHVAITASLAGVVSAPLSGPYCTSKFAAVALAECLHHDLSLQPGHGIGVSCVVPSAVRTDIARADRNRPHDLDGHPLPSEATAMVTAALAAATADGRDADDAATHILDRVLAGEFYVATSDSFDRLVPVVNDTRQRHAPPQLLMYD
ncbi:MAG TPA: SDR family NAD(P)-dependent oxidoreductase [Acidimicrobiia bacterium]|nr:SDR family NAD(P)-dependent oxidoreductase [Acidimicrobiia bacterium]